MSVIGRMNLQPWGWGGGGSAVGGLRWRLLGLAAPQKDRIQLCGDSSKRVTRKLRENNALCALSTHFLSVSHESARLSAEQ